MREDALQRARAHLRGQGIDAWLVCDFRGNNPALPPLLGRRVHATRRVALVVPASGQTRLVAHAIEAGQFREEGDALRTYATHEQFEGVLRQCLAGCRRVAMEYSPGGRLPAVSWVDGGTLDLVRGLGLEAVTSADLLQAALAVWSQAALEGHRWAAAAVVAARDAAFAEIASALAAGRQIAERDVQQRIGTELARAGLETDHAAIVGANAHSADPHYAPAATGSAILRPGDWVLIDLWGRRPGDGEIYADITWVARAAPAVTPRQQEVFDIVRRARDLVLTRLRDSWRQGEPVQGWHLDRAARDLIAAAGYGQQLLHRTGHSLSPGPSVHGLGANLDDVESRDTRTLLPGTGFTVEPGVYLPDFGVRLEIDVYLDPQAGPTVTTPVQEEVLLLL